MAAVDRPCREIPLIFVSQAIFDNLLTRSYDKSRLRVLKENSIGSFRMASDFPPLRCEYVCWKRRWKTVEDNRTSCSWKSFPYGKRALYMVNYAMIGLQLQRSGAVAVLQNPGPAKNQNCDLCYKFCRISRHGIQCDQCDTSFHQKCMNASDETYIYCIFNFMMPRSLAWISVMRILNLVCLGNIKCITLYSQKKIIKSRCHTQRVCMENSKWI